MLMIFKQEPKSGLKKLFTGDITKETRNLFIIVFFLLLMGTVFYRFVEDWRWIDSFYFTITTLTTVGYGDIAPQTDLGKIFTSGLIFGGLGVVLTFLQTFARQQAQEPFFTRLANIRHIEKQSSDENK